MKMNLGLGEAVPNKYEHLLAGYLSNNPNVSEKISPFLDTFPQLPGDPEEAFVAVQRHLIETGFTYDNQTFLLEDVIENKRGNCLGLCVLFGVALEAQGFDVEYEIAVNPRDAHYKNDISEFDDLIHGEVFLYDNPPDLPNEKTELPQGWFTPLEHPILILNGKYYETTSLLISEDSNIEHDYESESRRPVSLKNLIGSLYSSEAKMSLRDPNSNDYKSLINKIKQGLDLWPEDRQSWAMLRDVAIHNFDDESKKLAEEKFKLIGGDDSLFYYSLYTMTGDRSLLDRALSLYPAYIEAFVEKNITTPFLTDTDKKEAVFNLAVASFCVANSSELDMDLFYLKNITTVAEAFGAEYAEQLLYDLEIDNKWPVKYHLSLFSIKNDPENLARAIELGALEESTPLENLHICKTAVQIGEKLGPAVLHKCSNLLSEYQNRYSESSIFKEEVLKE